MGVRWWLDTRMHLARALLLCGRSEAALTQCDHTAKDGAQMLDAGAGADVTAFARQLATLRSWCAAQGLTSCHNPAPPTATTMETELWTAWCHRYSGNGVSMRYASVLPLLPAVELAAAHATWSVGTCDPSAVVAVRGHVRRCAQALVALGDGSERVGVDHVRILATALALSVGVASTNATADGTDARVPDTENATASHMRLSEALDAAANVGAAWAALQRLVQRVLQRGNGSAARDMCFDFALAAWTGWVYGKIDERCQVVLECARMAHCLAQNVGVVCNGERTVVQ